MGERTTVELILFLLGIVGLVGALAAYTPTGQPFAYVVPALLMVPYLSGRLPSATTADDLD